MNGYWEDVNHLTVEKLSESLHAISAGKFTMQDRSMTNKIYVWRRAAYRHLEWQREYAQEGWLNNLAGSNG